LDRKIDSLIKI